jgi:hypothetical protein
VDAGTYKVVLTVDGKEFTQPVRVVGDAPAPAFRFGADRDDD